MSDDQTSAPVEGNNDAAPAPNAAEQAAAWETMRTSLSGGNADRAKVLEGFASPDALFERITAEPPAAPDWRVQMAGEDQDALKFLEKYADPQQAMKAWRSLQTKLSEGGKVKVPGEGATPEEIAEYVKAIGVPEKVDGYQITAKPADGYEVSESDKAFLGGTTEKLHELLAKGAKPGDIVNFLHQTYYDAAAQSVIDAENAAADLAYEGEQANRKLWKEKYEENIQWAIAGAKQYFPGSEAEFEETMGLRMADGRALFDHPMIQRIFAQVGREHAEDPFFLAQKDGGKGFDPEKRITEIHAMRNGTADQRREYQKLSAPGGELEKLMAVRERKSGRAA